MKGRGKHRAEERLKKGGKIESEWHKNGDRDLCECRQIKITSILLTYKLQYKAIRRPRQTNLNARRGISSREDMRPLPVGLPYSNNTQSYAIPPLHPKSVSRAVLRRMQFTLHATRRTPHGASRLVQATSASLVKTRRAPSRHSGDARVYGHTTTAMHKLSTPDEFRGGFVQN